MTITESLTEQNRALVQKLYDAAISGDIEGVLGCLAEDVVVREPEFLPYGGTYSGRDTFLALFEKIVKCYDMTKISADYLVADGERVIGVLRMPDLKTGKDVLLAEQSTIRDGLIVDMRIFFHDAQSLIDAPKL